MMKMDQEIMELIDYRVNQKVAQMKAELREELAHFNQQSASADNGWHDFNKVERYLDSLIRVSSVNGHKVHDEINDAVKKLKEMAYE
jgi:hypothetical protein